MARGVNKVILIGNLGRDPEVRYMQSGGAVANVGLATSESWKDKNTGENQEKTEWHNLVFYGKLAEIVGEYCKKGAKIYVEGRIQTRKWQDKETNADRYTTEIIVRDMQMLDGRGMSGSSEDSPDAPQASSSAAPAPRRSSSRASAAPAAAAPMSNLGNLDDDIPF